jgi:hypothetical protein
MDSKEVIKEILLDGTNEEKKFLFGFDNKTTNEIILKKFKIFGRGLYPRYFGDKSAPFHDGMVSNYIKSYRGEKYLNIAFRGSAKTSLAKLFLVFVLLNDKDEFRKYIKVLTKDGKNSKQIVTDVYNLMIEVKDVYGDVFEKEGDTKREETMGSFTMKNGRKLSAGTVGQTQRGHVQDAFRPDWLWFDDVEDRDSIASSTITEGIINRIDEAISGLSFNGSYFVTANYISEYGSIQWFKDKPSIICDVIPIMIDDVPTWDRYTPEHIQGLKGEAKDFWGEYMCDPLRSENKFFDVNKIEEDIKNCTEPIRTTSGVKYWAEYLPHHRYAIGGDTAEGIGRDSNAMVGFDFTNGDQVLSYTDSQIAPDLFGHELMRVGNEYGRCLIAPERNNTGFATITAMKGYPSIYTEKSMAKLNSIMTNKIGWHTNARTKPNMFYEFRRDYNDGLMNIKDKNILMEMKAYTHNDIEDNTSGLVTRHFDLLTSAVIAWQMRNELSSNIDERKKRGAMMAMRNRKQGII